MKGCLKFFLISLMLLIVLIVLSNIERPICSAISPDGKYTGYWAENFYTANSYVKDNTSGKISWTGWYDDHLDCDEGNMNVEKHSVFWKTKDICAFQKTGQGRLNPGPKLAEVYCKAPNFQYDWSLPK